MGFLGFKQLFKDFDGSLVSPLHHGQRWVVGVNMESMHRYTYAASDKYDHNAEGKIHCDQCGFHSYKRPEFCEDYTKTVNSRNQPLARTPVWCVVDNNGFVVEHELGYRASHSKLIFTTTEIHELLDWCEDALTDHMPPELVEWCNSGLNSEWKSLGDHFNVTQNYLKNWLENGRDAFLIKPDYNEIKGSFPRGWGHECAPK